MVRPPSVLYGTYARKPAEVLGNELTFYNYVRITLIKYTLAHTS